MPSFFLYKFPLAQGGPWEGRVAQTSDGLTFWEKVSTAQLAHALPKVLLAASVVLRAKEKKLVCFLFFPKRRLYHNPKNGQGRGQETLDRFSRVVIHFFYGKKTREFSSQKSRTLVL
jgi:hypothetical protein